jgi:hypothetical protein
MRRSLREWDSKVTFFAFADVITSVSGMLIFITLLLATDLERPTESSSSGADTESERRLREALRQQTELDAENRRLQQLLAMAETAPASGKLESDIIGLRAQLDEANRKQNASAAQLTASQAAILARDRSLGLTELKTSIERTVQETASVAERDGKARIEMSNLEQQVSRLQTQLLKARQREGQLWIIPGKGTDKEPIFVTVAGSGVTVDRFDHPEQRRQFDSNGAETSFESYLSQSKPNDQYVVFEIRPSGIGLFEKLVRIARDSRFEVGFDALEENRQIHLSTPPSLDEPVRSTNALPTGSEQPVRTSAGSESVPPAPPITIPRGTNSPVPVTAPTPPPTSSKTKSWWQRILQWIGLA